jgi:hypothetical protein
MLVVFSGEKCDLGLVTSVLEIAVRQYCKIRKPTHGEINYGGPAKRPEMHHLYVVRPPDMRQNLQFN